MNSINSVHPISTINRLAQGQLALGNISQAQMLYCESIKLNRTKLAKEPLHLQERLGDLLETHGLLAASFSDQQEYDLASDCYEQAYFLLSELKENNSRSGKLGSILSNYFQQLGSQWLAFYRLHQPQLSSHSRQSYQWAIARSL